MNFLLKIHTEEREKEIREQLRRMDQRYVVKIPAYFLTNTSRFDGKCLIIHIYMLAYYINLIFIKKNNKN
jgi:hypothetical protein